jgi:hypothetical protein
MAVKGRRKTKYPRTYVFVTAREILRLVTGDDAEDNHRWARILRSQGEQPPSDNGGEICFLDVYVGPTLNPKEDTDPTTGDLHFNLHDVRG